MRSKILCLDIGARIIGVAISDAFGTMAFPRDEIRWGGDVDVLRRALLALAQENGIPGLVVLGQPQQASAGMQEALETAQKLLQELGWTTASMDEHVSTQEAANRIADIEDETGTIYTGRRDSVAAQIILERYLARS